LIDDSGIGEESVHLTLNFWRIHHVLNVVGIVGVDSHFCKRVEATGNQAERRSATSERRRR